MIRILPDDMAGNIIMLSITTRTSTNKDFNSGITETSDKWDGKGKKVNPLLGYFVNMLIYHTLTTIILPKQRAIIVKHYVIDEVMYASIYERSCK